MGWSAGNLPDQGTLCTEVMSREVLRAQLARPQSLGDAVAQQQAGETAASPGLFSVGVGHCRWLAGQSLALSSAPGPLPSREAPPWV